MRTLHPSALFLTITASALLAGCSGSEPGDKPVSNDGAGAAASALANVATPKETPPAKPQAIERKSEVYEFTYKWPGEAAGVPELDDWLRKNAEKLQKDGEGSAREDMASAKKDGFPYRTHSYDEKYEVVANTARMLVLLSDGYVYTGGAHGMPINTAIIWDKGVKKRLGTASLIDLPRLVTASRKRFCAELDKQREEKRGEPVKHDDPNEIVDFNQCVDMAKQLVLPVSTGGKALDTMRVVIGPYEAGPYAEGSYFIDLPFDAPMMATVKEEYRGAFAVAGK